MLKNRLIPVLFFRDGYLVRSEGFSIHQKLGNPTAQVERFNDWDVDELIYIDISEKSNFSPSKIDLGNRKKDKEQNFDDIIKTVSQKCFMPLTFGGGIRTILDARRRFELGADKITINSQAIHRPSFISELAEEFGSQAIILSIDAKRVNSDSYEVFTAWGREPTGITPANWANEAQDLGAGEIFINSIEYDGKATGYDIELICSITENTNIPVIACGGAGSYNDFEKAIKLTDLSAVAAGNIFNFKELAYPIAKNHLKKAGLNFR
jgi:cyclase